MVKISGQMTVQETGTMYFTPFARHTGPRYKYLAFTTYGEIKETQKDLVFTIRIPKRLGLRQVVSVLVEEVRHMKRIANELLCNNI